LRFFVALGVVGSLRRVAGSLFSEDARSELRQQVKDWNMKKPVMNHETRQRLSRHFQPDILALQDLISID